MKDKFSKPSQSHPNARAVNAGDEVYYQHTDGPKSGKVSAVGHHGATVEVPEGGTENVKWGNFLAHKQRSQVQMRVVDRGEDGAILQDEKGKRHFVRGSIDDEVQGYLDPIAKLSSIDADDILTRKIDRRLQELEPRLAFVNVGKLDLDGFCILTHTDEKTAPKLLKFLEGSDLGIDYDPHPSVQWGEGGDEQSGVLLLFHPDEENRQSLLNGLTEYRKKQISEIEGEHCTLVVMGSETVSGMSQAGLIATGTHGRSLVQIVPPGASDSIPAWIVDDNHAQLRKSYPSGVMRKSVGVWRWCDEPEKRVAKVLVSKG